MGERKKRIYMWHALIVFMLFGDLNTNEVVFLMYFHKKKAATFQRPEVEIIHE